MRWMTIESILPCLLMAYLIDSPVFEVNVKFLERWLLVYMFSLLFFLISACIIIILHNSEIMSVFQIILYSLLQLLSNYIMWLCVSLFPGCVYSSQEVLDLLAHLKVQSGFTNITGQNNLTSAIYLQGKKRRPS